MDTNAKEVELIELLDVVYKRRWLILIPTVILVAAAALVSFFLPRIWEVDAILVPSKFLMQTAGGQYAEVLVTDPKQITGQINEESYNAAIAAELKMDIRTFPGIRAENIGDTKLIRVSVRGENVETGRAILRSLFAHLKEELDRKISVETRGIETQITAKTNAIKDLENEIKTKENEIKKQNNNIKSQDFKRQSQEIEKDKLKGEIEANKNRIVISEERSKSITEELKAVKGRVDELDQQLKKVIAEKKEGGEAVSLLIYSNEVNQNLQYYNTLDEKLTLERMIQENLRLDTKENEDKIKQTDTQIGQTKAEIEIIRAEIDSILNEIENIKNTISTTQSEIKLLEDEKMRIDYARLVKEPTASLSPVSPKKKLIVASTAVVGLAVFSMLALLLEYVKKRRVPPD